MLNIQEKQDIIDKLDYWDARVLELSCNHFADEVTLVYGEDSETIRYSFNECYKVVFEHSIKYEKEIPVKIMKVSQIPYFLQDVKVGVIEENNTFLYTCKIFMPPLTVEIWCKDILIHHDK
ncbi:hypothetical protein [Alkaliphilus crotonatoxidans]